jgi:hypothetical protein
MPARSAELPALVPALPAHALVSAAARHGVSAMLADAFHAARVGFTEARQLLADARDVAAQAQRVRRAAIAVHRALLGAGVRAVALKGPVLAARLFPENPLARPSTDLDVLVEPGALDRTEAVLAAAGQRRADDPALADPLDDHHHLSFTGPLGLVEVHHRLTWSFGGGRFDDEAVLRRTVRTTFEGLVVEVLAPEDEFLYLATHAANHAFMRASWLVDLQRYLALHPSLDWVTMRARAERAGFVQALSVTLALLERALDVTLPPGAHAAFGPRLARAVVDQFLFDARRLESAALSNHRLASFALRLWMVDSLEHGARHLADGARRYLRRATA